MHLPLLSENDAIEALMLAVFDHEEGYSVSASSPAESGYEQVVRLLGYQLMPDQDICGRVVTLWLDGRVIVDVPVYLEGGHYDRSSFQFCLVMVVEEARFLNNSEGYAMLAKYLAHAFQEIEDDPDFRLLSQMENRRKMNPLLDQIRTCFNHGQSSVDIAIRPSDLLISADDHCLPYSITLQLSTPLLSPATAPQSGYQRLPHSPGWEAGVASGHTSDEHRDLLENAQDSGGVVVSGRTGCYWGAGQRIRPFVVPLLSTALWAAPPQGADPVVQHMLQFVDGFSSVEDIACLADLPLELAVKIVADLVAKGHLYVHYPISGAARYGLTPFFHEVFLHDSSMQREAIRFVRHERATGEASSPSPADVTRLLAFFRSNQTLQEYHAEHHEALCLYGVSLHHLVVYCEIRGILRRLCLYPIVALSEQQRKGSLKAWLDFRKSHIRRERRPLEAMSQSIGGLGSANRLASSSRPLMPSSSRQALARAQMPPESTTSPYGFAGGSKGLKLYEERVLAHCDGRLTWEEIRGAFCFTDEAFESLLTSCKETVYRLWK